MIYFDLSASHRYRSIPDQYHLVRICHILAQKVKSRIGQCAVSSAIYYFSGSFLMFAEDALSFDFEEQTQTRLRELIEFFRQLQEIHAPSDEQDRWQIIVSETTRAIKDYVINFPDDGSMLKIMSRVESMYFFVEDGVIDRMDKYASKTVSFSDLIADLFKHVVDDIREKIKIKFGIDEDQPNPYAHRTVIEALSSYNNRQGHDQAIRTAINLVKNPRNLDDVHDIYKCVAANYNLTLEQIVDYTLKKKDRNDLRHFENKIREFARTCQEESKSLQLSSFIYKYFHIFDVIPSENEQKILQEVFRSMCIRQLHPQVPS
jgi:hypothetical protein